MHFFYIDESGDTGQDLLNVDQPILVLGGVSVKDTGWTRTQSELTALIDEYFHGVVPDNFELHAVELLSPEGEGHFAGQPMGDRLNLAVRILDLIANRGHAVHFVGVDKAALLDSDCDSPLIYHPKVPWLLAYDYLVTYINWFVKNRLGQNTRGMIIHDVKADLHDHIERIAHDRRFEGAKTHRVKWVVEFSYPVDSKKNPMIQISDLVTYCTRRFLEIENGHRPDWSAETKQFYADCFARIDARVARKGLVERGGPGFKSLNEHLSRVRSLPSTHWKATWDVA